MVQFLKQELAKVIEEEGVPREEWKTAGQIIAARAVQDAISGKKEGLVPWLKFMASYTDGMPTQAVEMTGKDGKPMETALTVTFVDSTKKD